MYDNKPEEHVYLIRSSGSSLRRSSHTQLLLISTFLYICPIFDVILVWWTSASHILFSPSTLLKYCAVSFTGINVATSLTGFWGMIFKNEAALRASLALILMLNTLMLLCTSMVMVCLIFGSTIFAIHHAPPFFQYMENNRKIGIPACLLLIWIRISYYFLVWSITELENSYKGDYTVSKRPRSLDQPIKDEGISIDIMNE